MRTLLLSLLFLFCTSLAHGKVPYVLAILPDTQTACRKGPPPDGTTDDTDWPQQMIQYIVDEKAAYVADPANGRNIIGIVGVGDVTDAIAASSLCGDLLIIDWKDAFTDIAFAASMPVAVTAGNHDLDPTGAETIASGDEWRTYFPASYWSGKPYFNECADLAEGTRYGADHNCSFSFPTGNGDDKLHIITTEWHTTQTTVHSDTLTAARDWILATARKRSDEPLIIATHDNLHTNNTLNDDPATWSCFKPGVTNYWMQNSVLLGLRQFVGMISGHDVNGQATYDPEAHTQLEQDSSNWSCYKTGLNAFGNGYFEEFRDYQRMEVEAAQGAGNGAGLIWFMTIDEDAGTIASESCSPDTILDFCRTSFRETQTLTGINFSSRRPHSGGTGIRF